MNTEEEKKLMNYWNTMRGVVPTQDYLTATILVDKVRNQFLNQDDDDINQVYSALIETANALGIDNPFSDIDHFQLIYKVGRQMDQIDWEGVIAKMMEASKLPVLPTALVDIYFERFKRRPETVLIAEAEKFVPNLQRIIDENINSKFVLTVQNTIYAKALESVFEGYDNVEILTTGIYRYEFLDRRFDLILSFPAFGGRTFSEDKMFMCREMDMVALENLSLHLNSAGQLVITLPGRITFASGKVSDLRQFIQTSYTIREIAELPEGIIEYTGIKAYLLDIENSRPDDDDIIIRRYSGGERKNKRSAVKSLEITDDTFVMLSELEEQGDWNIDRIFSQQDEEYLRFQNSDIRKEKLGNVALIFRGKSINKKEQSGNIAVVNISNIGDYELDFTNLDHIQEEERKVANYLLQEGDLLIPARGTAIRTAVFHDQGYPCITSSNVIVIRPNKQLLDSTYLKIFLDSSVGNKVISGTQQGGFSMNISYKDLNGIDVPLPMLSEQQKKAEEYNTELNKYQTTISEAEERWGRILSNLQEF